jgi:thiol-disulfide isomerase/thioredoxin
MKTALYLLMALLVASCGTPRGYVITGKIADAEGKSIHLLTGKDEFFKIIDSTLIREDGRFEFKGELAVPGLLTLKILPAGERGEVESDDYVSHPIIPVFVDKGRVKVETTLDSIPLATFGEGYDYSKVRVTAPRLHDLYVEYDQAKTAATKVYREAFNDYLKYFETEAHVSEGIAAVKKINAVDKTGHVKRFIARNKDNAAGLYALQDNTGYKSVNSCPFTVAELDEILASFSPGMKATEYYKQVSAEVNEVKRTAVGARFVDVMLKDAGGNTVRLSDHAGKGRYVLFEFWASWCGPCRADIPHLKEVYELYHPAGFDIVSISLDENKAAWLKALEDEQMPWPQLNDEKAFKGIGDAYGILGIPNCVLVGPDGTIVHSDARGLWLDCDLVELYGNRFGDKY